MQKSNKKKYKFLIASLVFLILYSFSQPSVYNKFIHCKNNLHSTYNQLPLSNNLPSGNSIVIENENDDDEDKFHVNLFYKHISSYIKVSGEFYKTKYFSFYTFFTNLYSGIPIYSAFSNYRI